MSSWPQSSIRILLGLIIFLGGIYVSRLVFSPDLPLVGVIQWTREVKPFEDSLQGVIEGLREDGYQDGLNIRLEVINAQGEKAAAAAAAREFLKKKAGLLITVGTVPTLIALEVTRDTKIPIVYTLVGSPNATGLSPPPPPQAVRFTGTSMEVPVVEQLRFLLLARPGLKRLGILFCKATPQAAATGEEAERVSPSLGLTPILRAVTDDRPETLLQTVTDLVHEKIEALFIPTDPVLATTKNLKIICDATMRAFIPVMAPDGNSVAFGPLISYHCDFVEIGRQSGRQAARLLNGTPLDQVPPESPVIKKLTINLKVAHDLHMSLSRQLLSQADQFHQ